MTDAIASSHEQFRALLDEDASAGELERLLDSMDAGELLHSVFLLDPDEQRKLLLAIHPDRAAHLVEEIPESHAADLFEDMAVEDSAPIIEEMASDHRADVLQELSKGDAEAIIAEFDDDDAESARELIAYSPDEAGGLMMTEYAAYQASDNVGWVIEQLTRDTSDYQFLTVHYIYVLNDDRTLAGVVRLRDLVFANATQRVGDVATEALMVPPTESLDELENFFIDHDFAAVPVVDENNVMLGIVRRRAVLEALADRSESDHMKSAGIIGGDELRSMPVIVRSRRRLAWLSINIVLNVIAASVIAMYEDTLTAVIALAVFLPIVSDMSGCSGNQAVAVSMRELTLGAAKPSDVLRVLRKEAAVGLINGAALGLLLGFVAWLWKGSIMLSVVVGVALAMNTLIAVIIGGSVPLLLKRMSFDPAVASGPLLTTVTDMVGFFLLLSLATLVLPMI